MNKNSKMRSLAVILILFVVVALIGPSIDVSARSLAATAPTLGTVSSFAVLGASTVTSTGATVLNGDLGLSPGNAINILPPGLITGTTHIADAVAAGAQTAATTVVSGLTGQACNTDLTGQDLGGLTLTPGVYCFSSSAQLTGILTLDAQNDEYAVWVFKMGSSLTTASGSSVTYINSPHPICNVFWQVGSSATLGTTTSFLGNIFASASVTMDTNADLLGRAVAQTGAVTLDDNTVTPLFCYVAPIITPTPTSTPPADATGTPTLLPIVTALPDTGGAELNQSGSFTLTLGIIGLLCVVVLIFGVRAFSKTDRSK